MTRHSASIPWIVLALTALVGCDSSDDTLDGAVHDAGSDELDSGVADSGSEVDDADLSDAGSDAPDSNVADSGSEVDGADLSDAGSDAMARILSVYYGLDELPRAANLLCAVPVGGLDGVPVTFSVQLDEATIAPEDFAVETDTGERVTPECATLAPATEPLELRTVLLAGTFGTPEAQPRAFEVVGVLEDLDGNEITDLRSDDVTPLEDGPSLVLAERYLPTNPGIDSECPADTAQVVQLVWGGGVTGPNGARLGEPQRLGVSVRLEDGNAVEPIALADDDPDNFVYACLEASSPAVEVSVAAGLFHDPGDDANPATSAPVVDRTR